MKLVKAYTDKAERILGTLAAPPALFAAYALAAAGHYGKAALVGGIAGVLNPVLAFEGARCDVREAAAREEAWARANAAPAAVIPELPSVPCPGRMSSAVTADIPRVG